MSGKEPKMSPYSSLIPNTFQHPNSYVDHLHYYLTPEEAVVLDKAVREILGWYDKITTRRARIAVSVFVDGKRNHAGEVLCMGCGLCRSAVLKCLESLDRFGILIKEGSPNRDGQEYFLQENVDLIDWDGLKARREERDEQNRKRTRKARCTALSGLSDRPEVRSVGQTDNRSVGQTTERSVGQTQRNPIETQRNQEGGYAAEPAAHADAPAFWKDQAYIVTHYPDDLTFNCPKCDEQVPWPRKKSDFKCAACGVPLAGFELGNDERGTPDWKPPKKEVPEGGKRTLGNLIPDCPERLKQFPYFERDKVDIMEVLARNRQILLDEIDYQRQMYLKKQGRRVNVAHNGMVSARNKIGASRKDRDVTQTSRDPPASPPRAGGVPVWGGGVRPKPAEAS
jgi:hypothetical protein